MNKERDNNAHDGVERGPFGDDYLWNRSDPVDPQVEQLERLLSPYALRDPVRVPAAVVVATPRNRWLRAMALAAMLGCLMLGGYGWYWQRLQWPEGGGWDTALVAGQAMLDGRSLRDANAALQPGSVIETECEGRREDRRRPHRRSGARQRLAPAPGADPRRTPSRAARPRQVVGTDLGAARQFRRGRAIRRCL
jgi:hypothetical protein